MSVSSCASKKDEPKDDPGEVDPVTPDPGGDDPVDPIDESSKVCISTNYLSARTSNPFAYEFNLDDFKEIGDEPNMKVLKASVLFDANISFGAKVEFAKTDFPIEDFENNENFYKHLQLDGYEKIYIEPKDDVDVDDIAFLNVAHKKHDGKDICFITIADSGYRTTWNSNFDVGYDDDCYYDKTGEHPEWGVKAHHKGFDVAGNRIVTAIEEYKNRVLDANSPQIFYLFGHSRGGALANIVGAKLVDLEYNVASYGLASPAVTSSDEATNAKYNHLYSYVNSEDVITTILSQDWGFKRFGRTFSFSIQDYKEDFKKINGYDLPNKSGINLSEVLQSLVSGRDEIYEISDEFTLTTSGPLSKEEIDEYKASVLEKLSGNFERLRSFVEFEEVDNGDSTFTIKVKACPALLIGVFGIIMSTLNETISVASLIASFGELAEYIECFLNKAGLKMSDLISFNVNYLINCHTFPSYLTYIYLQ